MKRIIPIPILALLAAFLFALPVEANGGSLRSRLSLRSRSRARAPAVQVNVVKSSAPAFYAPAPAVSYYQAPAIIQQQQKIKVREIIAQPVLLERSYSSYAAVVPPPAAYYKSSAYSSYGYGAPAMQSYCPAPGFGGQQLQMPRVDTGIAEQIRLMQLQIQSQQLELQRLNQQGPPALNKPR